MREGAVFRVFFTQLEREMSVRKRPSCIRRTAGFSMFLFTFQRLKLTFCFRFVGGKMSVCGGLKLVSFWLKSEPFRRGRVARY